MSLPIYAWANLTQPTKGYWAENVMLFRFAANRCDSLRTRKISQMSFIFYYFWSTEYLPTPLYFTVLENLFKLPLLALKMDHPEGDIYPLSPLWIRHWVLIHMLSWVIRSFLRWFMWHKRIITLCIAMSNQDRFITVPSFVSVKQTWGLINPI